MGAVLKTIYRGWMAFARALGRINTVLVLTLIYFLVLPVFSLLRFKDPLNLRRGKPPRWLERPPLERSLERFTHPY
jgi:hypothetical protein